MSEIVLKINTELGQNTFSIEKIEAKLDSIIVRSPEKVEIIIESDLEYLIYQQKEFIGTKYIPIRAQGKFPIQNLIDTPSYEKFNLNERLIITVIGPKNVDIDIILRFD